MKNISDGRKDKWKDERTDGRTDRRTEVKQYTPSPSGTGGIKNPKRNERIYISISDYQCRYNQKYHRVSDNEKQLSV